MPTKIEVQTQTDDWKIVGEIKPGFLPGSMTNMRDDGQREMVLFVCAEDDSRSVVGKSGLGVDWEVPLLCARGVAFDPNQFEVLAILNIGDEPYQMIIKTEISPQGRTIRFSHT